MSKPTVFGVQFDSQLECDRYLMLLEQAQNGKIDNLICQPGPFELLPARTDPGGHRWRAIRYTPDFAYHLADGTKVIEEVKPAERKARSWGRDVPIKLRLLADIMDGWQVRVWTPETQWGDAV